ncbi:TolC family protein [Vibrio sp.]|nr:TolC family protein [Vibrio sp.]
MNIIGIATLSRIKRIEKSRQMNKKTALTVLGSLLLVGCSVTPEALTEQQIIDRATWQFDYIEKKRQTNVESQISLVDAISIALRNNFELESVRLQHAIKNTEQDQVAYYLLPQSNLSYNHTIRNNDGGEEFDFSPPEKDRKTISGGVSWSAFDLGSAYLEAKRTGNAVLISEEYKRRVASRIVRETISAYILVASMKESLEEVSIVKAEVVAKLEEANSLVDSQLLDPIELLTYQEQLLTLLSDISLLEEEYLKAKQQLAIKINAQILDVNVLGNQKGLELALPSLEIHSLEKMALLQRAELREADYQIRNSEIEVKKTWLSAIPNIEIGASYQFDDEPSLANSEWVQLNIGIVSQVLNLISLPSRLELQKQKVEFERLNSILKASAVLGEVREAYLSHQAEKQRLSLYNQRAMMTKHIDEIKQSRLAYGPLDELDQFRSKVNVLTLEVQQRKVQTDYQTKQLQLVEKLGFDLFPSYFPLNDPTNQQEVVTQWLDQLPVAIAQLNNTPFH